MVKNLAVMPFMSNVEAGLVRARGRIGTKIIRYLCAFFAAALVAAVAFTAPFSSVMAAETQHVAASSEEIAKCREIARQAGIPASELEGFLNVSPAELPGRLEVCLGLMDSAYPSRSVDPVSVERGRILFTTYGCGFCHGTDARGGDGGPNLMRSERVLRDQKGEKIGEVVLKGVPNTAMRAFVLKPDELANIAEFLHSFRASHYDPARHPPVSILTGNAAAGEKYVKTHCVRCHSSATDLQSIGARYQDPRALQQTWLMPKCASPVTAVVTRPDGSTVEGRLMHVDEFLVTLSLADGTQRSFERAGSVSDLVIRDPLAAHKALLPTYTDKNIRDVTAYLATQRHSPQSVPKSNATGAECNPPA